MKALSLNACELFLCTGCPHCPWCVTLLSPERGCSGTAKTSLKFQKTAVRDQCDATLMNPVNSGPGNVNPDPLVVTRGVTAEAAAGSAATERLIAAEKRVA